MSKERLEEIKIKHMNMAIENRKNTISFKDALFIFEFIDKIEQQNKRYREAIDYVMTAEITHYDSVEQLLADVKYVIEKTLEDEE